MLSRISPLQERDGELKPPPLPISSEFDRIQEQFFYKDGVDRSSWLEMALHDCPEAAEYRERVNPVARAVKFGELYLPPNRIFSQQILLSLISQHLHTLGLVESQSSLHEEWDGPFDIPAHLLHSQLTVLIQRGIMRAEAFWDLDSQSARLTPEQLKTAIDEEISRTIGDPPTISDDSAPMDAEIIGDPKLIVIDPQTRVLQRATINQLILLLTSQTDIILTKVAKAFCLTYKSVVSSQALFSKLRERFRMVFRDENKASAELTFKLFKKWISKAGGEIEQPIFDAIKLFADTELKQHFPKLYPTLFGGEESDDRAVAEQSNSPQVLLGKCADRLWTGGFSLRDLPETELARQMTVWTSQRYYAVQRSELLDGAWQSPRLKHRAPNVVSLINHVNSITNWVASEILSGRTLQARLKTWQFFIELMKQLWELKNYCDAFAVHGGFETNEVYRLKVHRSMIGRSQSEFMEEVAHIFGDGGPSHRYIRELHQKALEGGSPSIPYLGILLSDLFKYSEVEPSFIEGKINVEKCKKTYGFIKKFEEYKEKRYNFLSIEQVQGKIGDLPTIEETSLYTMSLDVEPEESTEASLKDLQRKE